MTTTRPEFGATTEALEVAAAFRDEIKGKIVLITGVNRGGIGYTTAEAFASQGAAHIIIAGRSQHRLDICVRDLKTAYPDVDIRPLILDLSSQRAVRQAAAEVLSWEDIPVINILVNNAAVMNLPERTLSEDGIETTFATNHVGHFLFTNLIMPKLLASTKTQDFKKGTTRIINVTSLSPTRSGIRWSDINFDKINRTLPKEEQPNYQMLRMWGAKTPEELKYHGLEAYNQSKAANVLFSIGLNRRLADKHGVLSFAVHPGIIRTELSRYADEATSLAIDNILKTPGLHIKTLGGGSATTLVAATDPGVQRPETREGEEGTGKENKGVYWIDCRVSELADARAVGSREAERLWGVSEELVGEKFDL